MVKNQKMQAMRNGPLLRTALNRDDNSLNFIRLSLAIAVIVSHSFAIGFYGPEPEVGGVRLGSWAVLGFFALSGYLITASRVSSSVIVNYYVHRVLRIFPGFIVCVFIIAFVFAPLSSVIDRTASWQPGDAVLFVLRNLPLYPPVLSQPEIEGTLQAVPYGGTWNGSLWTLFWEFACYVLVGFTAHLGRRRLPVVYVLIFLLTTLMSLANELQLMRLPEIADRVLPLIAAFVAGGFLFLRRDRLRLTGLVLAASALAIVVVVVVVADVAWPLASAPLALLLLWAGSCRPASLVKSIPDVSYGLYIYAWPVQQMLMVIFGATLGVALMIVLTVVGTLAFAYPSYRFIEKPAQDYGRKRFPTRIISASASLDADTR